MAGEVDQRIARAPAFIPMGARFNIAIATSGRTLD